jgi:hypothetical protein
VDERINERLQKSAVILRFSRAKTTWSTPRRAGRAVHYLKAQGMKVIIGPASRLRRLHEGLLFEGFDSLNSLFNPYNPPYYHTFFHRIRLYEVPRPQRLYAQVKDFPAEAYEKLSDMAEESASDSAWRSGPKPDNGKRSRATWRI